MGIVIFSPEVLYIIERRISRQIPWEISNRVRIPMGHAEHNRA